MDASIRAKEAYLPTSEYVGDQGNVGTTCHLRVLSSHSGRLAKGRKTMYALRYPSYLARAFKPPYWLLLLYGRSKRRKGKNAPPIEYPDIPSSIAPVPHNNTVLPVPQPPMRVQSDPEEASSEDSETEQVPPSCVVGRRRRRKVLLPNQKIWWLIREKLTKSNAEIVISRLKQWDLLDDGVRITSQRKRHRVFSTFFSFTGGFCYCHSITGLFEAIGIPCNPSDWRLFIDSSSRSLKAVLLHNTNQWPSIPLAHSVHMKETYENVKILLSALKYTQYNWEITRTLIW